MAEQELKIGQSVDYEIAGQKLVLKPLPLGKMKKATAVFTDKGVSGMDMVTQYLAIILDNNSCITSDWIMENITIPQANEIMDASRQINGLGSFFHKGAPTETPASESPNKKSPEERAINETTPIHLA